MYHLINSHIAQLLPSIEGNHITDYDWLIQNLPDVETPIYQRRYRTYWRLNAALLSPDFCQVYFERLHAGLLDNDQPQVDSLAMELYEIPTHQNGRQSLQFSFCSKLCHMLNTHIPIYDRMIRSFYFFNEPGRHLPLQQRVNQYFTFYQFLTNEYSRILTDGLLVPSIQAFREHFNPLHFTDIKVVDSLIWAFITLLRNNGLANGQISYC